MVHCSRWYVDNNIRWFFICSTVAATTSLLCLIITAAALAAIQEQRSNEELYRSIYYDQGLSHQQHIKQQPPEINTINKLPSLNQSTEINTTEQLPSPSLRGSQKNDSSIQVMHGHMEQNKKLPATFYDLGIIDKDTSQQLGDNSEQANILGILRYTQDGFQHVASEQSTLENGNSEHEQIHKETAPGNIIQKPDVSPDHTTTSTDTPADEGSAMWKLTEKTLEIKNAEYKENGATYNSAMMQNDSKTKSEMLPTINAGNTTNSESTHIMRIANIKTDKTKYVPNELLNNHDQKLDPPANTNGENQFNRQKKSTDDYQNKDLLNTNDGHLRTVITEGEHIHLLTFNNEETQDVMTIPSIKYETQDEEIVSQIIHNTDDSNQTLAKFSTSEQRFEQEPQYKEVRRGAREVRTVVAINILVASALELAWSILSASIAWKGMRNYYPHENTTSCERTVEGLERSLPAPPSPNNTYTTDIRHHKSDSVFRKPDIISNHRHCHTGNSIHARAVQNKNDRNRLHVINTVSERIHTEPYLPMEESTMEYQERVHRFLASNNVVNNTTDSASNVDS
jgi:hypothetical protein